MKKFHYVVLHFLNKSDHDVFGSYFHMGGRIGVLTVLEGTNDEEVAKDIAMHIAAANPSYVSREDVRKKKLTMKEKF